MTSPPNWVRRTDAPLDRATVVFDLDGVIADASHRQRFLRGGRRDFDGFFGACVHDTVIPAGAALATAIESDHTVVILTARPDTIRSQTLDWLRAHAIRHDLLILRPPLDQRSSAEFKRDELAALRVLGCDIRTVLEDSPSNLDMLRAEAYPVIPVASGYYDA